MYCIFMFIVFVFANAQHGANVNVADLWKYTPLHEAAAKGKLEICKLLLRVSYSVFSKLYCRGMVG